MYSQREAVAPVWEILPEDDPVSVGMSDDDIDPEEVGVGREIDGDGVGSDIVSDTEAESEGVMVNVAVFFETVTVSIWEVVAVISCVSVFWVILLVRLVDVVGGAVKDRLGLVWVSSKE